MWVKRKEGQHLFQDAPYNLWEERCFCFEAGWVSCLFHGDRSGHRRLFASGTDKPGAAWPERAGFPASSLQS